MENCAFFAYLSLFKIMNANYEEKKRKKIKKEKVVAVKFDLTEVKHAR